MTTQKTQKIKVKDVYDNKYFFEIYDDGKTTTPKGFVDDGCVHIAFRNYRYTFYNGQGRGEFKEKDVQRFANLVRKAKTIEVDKDEIEAIN